jgi:hypothetical protein
MDRSKTSRRGAILVMGILVVAVGVAFSSRLYYKARHPSATEAHFSGTDQVLAEFDRKAAQIIRVGLPASVSVASVGYEGTVTGRQGDSSVLITLDPGREPPAPGTPCRVIVDASIAPEFLK